MTKINTSATIGVQGWQAGLGDAEEFGVPGGVAVLWSFTGVQNGQPHCVTFAINPDDIPSIRSALMHILMSAMVESENRVNSHDGTTTSG